MSVFELQRQLEEGLGKDVLALGSSCCPGGSGSGGMRHASPAVGAQASPEQPWAQGVQARRRHGESTALREGQQDVGGGRQLRRWDLLRARVAISRAPATARRKLHKPRGTGGGRARGCMQFLLTQLELQA